MPLLRVHPIVWGIGVGFAAYLSIRITGVTGSPIASCVGCWVESVDSTDVVVAVSAGGTAGGTKALKDWIEKKVSLPIFTFKDMYDIASQETEEQQSEQAFKKYKSLIMIEDAPEGSIGGDLGDLIDKFSDLASQGIDLDKDYGKGSKKKKKKP